MGSKRIDQIDTDTGEVIGGFVAVIQPKRRNSFDGWFAMNQNALRELRSAGLHGRDYEVLFALLEVLDFENLIQVSQADIAKELKMKPPHLSRSIKSLIDLGVLLEGPKIGRSKSYRLNPGFGWKGSATNHNKAVRERMRAAGLSVLKGGSAPEGDAHLQRDAFE